MAEPEQCARGEAPRGAPSSCRCGGRGPHPAKRGLFLPPPEGVPYGLVLARLLWATSLTACTPGGPGHVCAEPSAALWPRPCQFCGCGAARFMPDDTVVLRHKTDSRDPPRGSCAMPPSSGTTKLVCSQSPSFNRPGLHSMTISASQLACQLRWHGSASSVSIWRPP